MAQYTWGDCTSDTGMLLSFCLFLSFCCTQHSLADLVDQLEWSQDLGEMLFWEVSSGLEKLPMRAVMDILCSNLHTTSIQKLSC